MAQLVSKDGTHTVNTTVAREIVSLKAQGYRLKPDTAATVATTEAPDEPATPVDTAATEPASQAASSTDVVGETTTASARSGSRSRR